VVLRVYLCRLCLSASVCNYGRREIVLNMETIYKLKNKYFKGLIGKLGVVVFQIVCLKVVDFVLFVYWGAAILADAEAVMVTAFRGGGGSNLECFVLILVWDYCFDCSCRCCKVLLLVIMQNLSVDEVCCLF
jgi:hypothetical protein